MAYDVKIPAVGESITEGILSRWLVKDGATVGDSTPLFELETDKITTEVPAGAAGVVHFTAKEGETLPIGAVVCSIDTAAVPSAAAAPAKAPAAATPAKTATPAAKSANAGSSNPTLSPAVKQLVADNDLDPARIPGTGPGELITKGDVLAHMTSRSANDTPPGATMTAPSPAAPGAPATTAPSTGSGKPTRTRMSSLRQRIAQRLVQAQHTAAILTTFNEIDMSAVMELRKRHKEEFEKKLGVSLGFMSFFAIATIKALQKYPLINSQIDGTEILGFENINLGIAVGTEKGLVVPVLRAAEKLSFAGIEKAIKAFALKAREGKLTIDDLQGGTFTITNGGTYGSLMSTPIINPPQSGILGMHTIKERPIALAGQVVIRPMMYVALSYDHRIIDGAEAVGFLVRIKDLIEAPEKLLLGL
jgi:2-oxoglutarate dehydrogenase E2 component (dihydrolipoamide succinyltransferase)